MLKSITRLFARNNPQATEVKADEKLNIQSRDPLDPFSRSRPGWEASETKELVLRSVDTFPLYESQPDIVDVESKMVGDSAMIKSAKIMDDSDAPVGMGPGGMNSYTVPQQLQNWYMAQGFPGYQALAIIAQHWMVDKACSMVGEDAVRNGWKLKAGADELKGAVADQIRELDKSFKIKENLAELNRFKNIFGIRVALFEVESDDPQYYEKPFNIDGVTPGSYKAISQVDPYWMMPMMTAESTSDPSSPHFYDPEYWIISGKKFHRSHLIIARGPEPADILKPTYIFGGVSLVQRIYERVYAAERTANEAPLLAMNKRTTAIHVDMDKAVANEDGLLRKLGLWIRFRDNHAVKVLGQEETMEQFDTSLADFDNVIMSQYQLVASIARTPATKLLGTPPKGFNATGEFEMVSYHEEQESIQEHTMQPMLDRHYLLLGKSLQLEVNITAVFEPVDSLTTTQQADLNNKNADTDTKYITAGVVSPDESRNKLRQDRHAGYTTLTTEEANQKPGMSPENIAAYAEAGAEMTKAGAAVIKSGASSEAVAHGETTSGEPIKGAQQIPQAAGGDNDVPPVQKRPAGEAPVDPYVPGQQPVTIREPGIDPAIAGIKALSGVFPALGTLASLLERIDDFLVREGQVPQMNTDTNAIRTSQPSVVRSTEPSTAGMSSVTPQMEPSKLPKMKLGGMTLAIENPRGSIRKGMDVNGKQWSAKMTNHYGFVKGTQGADGDDVDCFVGPNVQSQRAFIINQNDPNTGEFDEHKCMLGFDTPEDAKSAYDNSYSQGWTGYDSMHEISMPDFKTWAFGGVKDQPYNGNPLSAANLPQAGSMPETA